MYRCDVSYNNIVVSSQTVTLDVTHTYSIADSASTYSATRRRVNYLNAGLLRFFRPVAAENESGLKPDEGGTTDSGSATGGTTGNGTATGDATTGGSTGNGTATDATTGGGASASADTGTATGSTKAASTSGTPQTGDTAPGIGTLALIALGGAVSLIAALVLRHRSGDRG